MLQYLIDKPEVATVIAAIASAILAAVACMFEVISLQVSRKTLQHQHEQNRLPGAGAFDHRCCLPIWASAWRRSWPTPSKSHLPLPSAGAPPNRHCISSPWLVAGRARCSHNNGCGTRRVNRASLASSGSRSRLTQPLLWAGMRASSRWPKAWGKSKAIQLLIGYGEVSVFPGSP